MRASKLIGAVVAGLLVSMLSVPAAHAATVCGGDSATTQTFRVKVSVAERLYQLGDKARFFVRVNRVVEGLDLGPVTGAEVGVAVSLSDVHLLGGGITDNDGRAVVEVKLRRYAPAGLADVQGYATKLVAQLPCHIAYEYEHGSVKKPDLFRVAR